ncbi:MAG TPA: alpha/beta hydrolase [Bacteroidia bacterium]|jgi:pimeloyl-ACP methyl ester carboxylesterase|nr:alpha/beta hydrolase [Bacteroidia bacterium]
MKKIYLIGGLGVDERVFTNIHFENYEKQIVRWIEPLKDEPLAEYCKRLLTQIDSSEPVTIAGVSFGGIVANEISKLIPVKQIILISSIRSWREMPWYFRLSGKLNLHRLIPLKFARRANRLMRWFFLVKDPIHRQLLMDIARETSPTYLKWALNAAVRWRGEEVANTLQVHSNKDRTFPLRYIKRPDLVIKGVGHFMVVQKATEVSGFIDGISMPG